MIERARQYGFMGDDVEVELWAASCPIISHTVSTSPSSNSPHRRNTHHHPLNTTASAQPLGAHADLACIKEIVQNPPKALSGPVTSFLAHSTYGRHAEASPPIRQPGWSAPHSGFEGTN
jgi:hypothetical protein